MLREDITNGQRANLSTKEVALAIGSLVSVICLQGCAARRKLLRLGRVVANMAKDIVIPIEVHNAKDFVPPRAGTIEPGQQIFLQNCGPCHGSDGHGDTDLDTHMIPPAMDLTCPCVQHWSNGDLFWIIQNGISLTGMASWSSSILSTGTWKIAQSIHALPRLDPEQTQAASVSTAFTPPSQNELIAYDRALYHLEGCFMSHQFDGQDRKVGPDLSDEGTRGQKEQCLAHGPFQKSSRLHTPGAIMPSFKNFTPKQLEAVLAFLQNQDGPKE